VRAIRVITETAIPTIFQVELAEAAEAGTAEDVDEGETETVGFQEVTVISGAGPFDGKTVRVPDGMANLVAEGEEKEEEEEEEGEEEEV